MGQYRRPSSNPFEYLATALFFGIGAIVFVPFLIAVEIKAWQARHRIRKEEAARQA